MMTMYPALPGHCAKCGHHIKPAEVFDGSGKGRLCKVCADEGCKCEVPDRSWGT